MTELSSCQYFNSPSWRRVISQLREIFNDLHQNIETKRDEEKYKMEQINLSELCLETSQKYLNVIENELKLIGNSEEEKEIEESLKILFKVWKLCHIIFIKSSPSGTLLMDLQEWYRTTNNIDHLIQELFSLHASNTDQLYLDENYWALVLISVAQGRIDTVRHLLSFHPLKNSSVFKAVDDQLRTMPNFSTLSHLSLFEFKAKWEYWQKKCIQVLTSENFSIEETGSLEIICKMLCADESTFLNLKPIFNNWYYMLISLMSYSNPTFNISDLHLQLASNSSMNQFKDELTDFDVIIHRIFDFDVDEVIQKCVELFSNNLLSAHLLDILYLNGKLQLNKHEMTDQTMNNIDNSILMHEKHLTKYALQLLSAAWSTSSLSLNQTAFDYLIKCTNIDNSGIELIETYLERLSLTYISEKEANKIFYLAFQFGLHDLAFSIGRVMQMRAFKRGLYGTALSWNVRIKDSSFGNYLAEKILEEFFQEKDLNLLELTESLSKEIIYSDRLIFLSKYREYYKLVKLTTKTDPNRFENLKQAGNLLVQLLEAPRLIPNKYRKRIFFDIADLVPENVFSEDQLFSILRIVQAYENRKNYFKDGFRFNQSKETSEEMMVDQEVKFGIEDGNEVKKWRDFLDDISKRIAENFLKNTIEI